MPRLDVRSKIIAALFAVGAVATLVVALLGYQSGRANLTERIFAQLTSVTQATATQTETYFAARRGQTAALAKDLMIVEATARFARAAEEAEAGPEAAATLSAHYEGTYLPQIAAAGSEPVVEAYLPTTPEGIALQAAYLANAGAGARAPAAYAGVHDRFHPALSAIAAEGGYADVFLITPDGFVAYTVLKEPDFATDLLAGPYADTGLARAFRAARAARDRSFVHLEDFAFYAPSLGVPAAFFAAPLFDGDRLVGVLALQVNADELNALVNQDGRWTEAGLGAAGEVFLVGADRMLRSQPRPFVEDADAFAEAIRANGADARTLALMERYGTPVLLQSATSEAVEAALRGETGIRGIPGDYTGRPALSASAPLDIPGLDWAVVAEMPTAEAYAPVRDFTRRLIVTAALLSIALTVAAMLLAARFMAPFRVLARRMNAVAAGDLDTRVAMDRRDEFGELSRAAQAVVDSLKERSDTAAADRERARSLLSRFLPEGAVRALSAKMAAGEDDARVAEELPAITMVHLRLSGLDALLDGRSPSEGVAVLDALTERIDAVAERLGVEKIRTHGGHYYAAAGLSAPLLDHDHRAVAFAVEAAGVIDRFAREEGVPLGVHVGAASGPAVMAVTGRNRLAFEVWGAPAAQSERLADAAPDGEARLSEGLAAAVGKPERLALRAETQAAPA